jgi:hypothetical protein
MANGHRRLRGVFQPSAAVPGLDAHGACVVRTIKWPMSSATRQKSMPAIPSLEGNARRMQCHMRFLTIRFSLGPVPTIEVDGVASGNSATPGPPHQGPKEVIFTSWGGRTGLRPWGGRPGSPRSGLCFLGWRDRLSSVGWETRPSPKAVAGPAVEAGNEVRPNLRRNPKGRPVFPISLSLVALVIDHSTLLAPRIRKKTGSRRRHPNRVNRP